MQQLPMRPCVSTTTSASKKSKTPPWPSNKSSKTNIDDLPYVVLIEILSRLPHSRILFQCKCVCKRWSSLISNDELRSCYLWHQSRGRRQNNGTLIFRDPKKKREFFILPELELPMFKSHNFSLRSFLPCFEDPEYVGTEVDEEPVVLGVCNDLVLCCATMSYQRDYYICNPCTKQYVQVPPSPIRHKDVRVGFICDPYVKEQVDQRLQDNSYTQVDVDFRFAIVRILNNWDDPKYYSQYQVEIFSSETGRWTQSIIKTPYLYFPLHMLHRSGGIAHNGMLCWWSDVHDRGFIGLDPYSNNPACFYSIDAPHKFLPDYKRLSHLISVCRAPRGRLRLCHLAYDFIDPPLIFVWELKDDEEWCNLTAGGICIRPVLHERMIPYDQWGGDLQMSIDVLAFDPSNEDIVYLQVPDRIVTCNIRERKFEETTILAIPYNENDVLRFGKTVFPFVIPSWPTPLPKLQIGQQEMIYEVV